ncbi:MAG TPA: hypothetical protein VGX00_01990 [Thermoplasmata archaeon]|nr:hypothetical protein [Thermoplasmata archaeon]
MTYYPTGHDVLLFGGYGCTLVCNDTWSFAHGNWTDLVPSSTCTSTTCPSPRADAMMAYYAPLGGVLLFGGGLSFFGVTHAFGDTWLFQGGAWRNISGTVGTAPSPRFDGAMTWDSLDNYVLLFGGSLATGATLGDTWIFNGTWHNISASVGTSPPSPRAGMAIANSPSGYILMYGGEAWNGTASVILNDFPTSGCFPLPHVAYWFYGGVWSPIKYPACPNLPFRPAVTTPGDPPPCGRTGAALGWSPKNAHFVLYGGYGTTFTTTCSGPIRELNDTWTYTAPPGTSINGFAWAPSGDSGDPSNRSTMGYAADLTDGYFVLFGGTDGTNAFNSTWRYYALVHARLTGPSDIETNASKLGFTVPFTVFGEGGTGTLEYAFSVPWKLNSNLLTDSGSTGCAELSNQTGLVYGPLPGIGTAQITCTPTPQSYNQYRVTVHVWDVNNVSDSATSDWSFRVHPPETIAIHSQFSGYFYSGVTFPNKFAVYTTTAGANAVSVRASLGGVGVPFVQRSGAGQWWDASVDIGTIPYGPQILHVIATFASNWTLDANYTVNVIETPDWLLSVIKFPQVTQTIATKGAGPFNESYSITEAFQWSLDKALGFNIELPFVKGNVSLIPAITVSLKVNSAGNLTLGGSLSLKPPSIDLGPASVGITLTFALKATFKIASVGGEIQGITWQTAVASFTLAGKFSASVPIYGFNILGVKVGFTLEVEVDPSITLGLVLAPTTPGFDEFISGIQVKIQQFIGSFTLPLSLAVNFGIGIASIGIGGQISIAVNFATTTGLYIPAGWINGSIFVEASFLWWSDQWDLASGTIYSWTSPPPPVAVGLGPPPPPLIALPGAAYNNGTNTTWSIQSRYYLSPSYDRNVWSAAGSAGPAISDIYPHTEVSTAAAADGSFLFYTNDNANLSASQGLGVSALRLDPTTNALSRLPAPNDPNFILSSPRATTLPDGSIYLLWDALPIGETGVASPASLTTLELHGARFDPVSHTWGPTRTWTSWGLAQSYRVDATGGEDTVAALVSSGYLLGSTSPEHLVVFNLDTGAEVGNSSVHGLSTVVSVRGALGEALVQDVGGNYSTVTLGTGTSAPIGFASPIGGSLVSAELASGSPSTAVLLYRASNRSVLALYDLSTGQTVANLPLGEDAFEAEAVASGSNYDVFVRTPAGIQGWLEAGGAFTNLTDSPGSGVVSYSLVQDGSGLVIDSLVASGPSSTPTLTLYFSEVGASLPPITRTPSPPVAGSHSTSPNYPLYLGIVAAADVLLLAVVAVWANRRSRPPASPPSPPTAPVTPPPPGSEPG